MPLAAAVAGAAILGTGASISASNKAAKTAKKTAASNNALQQSVYNENKATLSPYVGTGNNATKAIEGLLGIGGDPMASSAALTNYQNSTGYQARLAEGQRQVTAALGGKGLLDSGAAQKALLKYGQTFASGEFGNYLGALQGQQQTGLSAAGQQGVLGQNYGNAVANNNNAASAVRANSYLANAAAINNGLNSIVGAYGMSQGLGSSYKPSGGQGGLLSGTY